MVKQTKKAILAGLILAYAAGFGTTAHAHSFWANVTEHALSMKSEHSRQNKVFLGWGHHFPVDEFLQEGAVTEYAVVGPDGSKKPIAANSGEFMAAELKFDAPGAYFVSAVKKPGYYTVYTENGRTHHVGKPKTGLPNVSLSLFSQQFAKALVTVDGAGNEDVARAIGHKLEIIPLENPANGNGAGGRLLPVKVLLDGKPAESCQVFATYQGFSSGDDYAFATYTDNEGIAKIRISHWGKWLVKASVRKTAPADMREQCNQISYSATLTFEVP